MGPTARMGPKSGESVSRKGVGRGMATDPWRRGEDIWGVSNSPAQTRRAEPGTVSGLFRRERGFCNFPARASALQVLRPNVTRKLEHGSGPLNKFGSARLTLHGNMWNLLVSSERRYPQPCVALVVSFTPIRFTSSMASDIFRLWRILCCRRNALRN